MSLPIYDKLATTGATMRPLDGTRWREADYPNTDSLGDISAPVCCPRGSTRPMTINDKLYAQTIIFIAARYWDRQ